MGSGGDKKPNFVLFWCWNISLKLYANEHRELKHITLHHWFATFLYSLDHSFNSPIKTEGQTFIHQFSISKTYEKLFYIFSTWMVYDFAMCVHHYVMQSI